MSGESAVDGPLGRGFSLVGHCSCSSSLSNSVSNRVSARSTSAVVPSTPIRTTNGPRIMALLRNLTITLHRLAGATNIATAPPPPRLELTPPRHTPTHQLKHDFAESLGRRSGHSVPGLGTVLY